jgi:hypothetical protein
MQKLLLFLGTTLGGWLGYWLGDALGVMTAYWLSGLGSLLGIYVGWKLNHEYFG